MTIKKRILLALLALASFLAIEAVVIHYSIQFEKKWQGRNLSAVQGALDFNSYENYKQLEHLLDKQCYASALAMVRFYKEDSLSSLRYNLRAANDPGLDKYVRERDESALTGPFPNLPLPVSIPSCTPPEK